MALINKVAKGVAVLSGDVKRIARREMCFYRSAPVSSLLFLTYRCNSHCKTCTLWKRSAEAEKKKEIGFEEWKVIIDKLADAGVKTAELFGGNVLLRKELLIALLAYLKEKQFIIHLPTNQIGLDDDIAAAIAANVDYLYISVDGIGDYQDAIRGLKGSSQRAEGAVSKLLDMRKQNKTPQIICNTTVSKYNAGILEELVEYASARKFDEISFEYAGEFTQEHIDHSLIEGLKPTPYFIKQDESILVERSDARRLKESVARIGKKHSGNCIGIATINMDILSEENLYKGTIPHKKCYVERTNVTVDPSGNVIGCPFFNNYFVGNLAENPFDALWNNEKHLKFRYYQNSGAIQMCRHCILGVERNPGVMTSLRRMYLRRIAPELRKLI